MIYEIHEKIYILVYDEDDNVIHKELFEGLGFPTAQEIAKVIEQAARFRSDMYACSAKIDKRTVLY